MSDPSGAGQRVCVFVINLDKDDDRLRRFARIMEFYDVPFERWPATRGSDLDHTQFGVRPLAPGIFVKDFDEWSRNEAACGVSHIRLLQHIVHQEIPWAVVLEDDAIVRRALPPVIEDWFLPADADIVMLNQRAVTDERPDYLDLPAYGPVKGGAGTEGYLISLEGARKLLRILMPLRNPLDFQMYSHFRSVQLAGDSSDYWRLARNPEAVDLALNSYRIIPSLVQHAGNSSTIGNGRHPRAHFFCRVLLGVDFGEPGGGGGAHGYGHPNSAQGIAPVPHGHAAQAIARNTLHWRGVDVSHWDPRQSYSSTGRQPRGHLFDVLLDAGVNIIRFNIFLDGLHHPFNLDRAKAIATAAADRGLDICVVLHFSDTWAYPSEQVKPLAWRNLSYSRLVNEVQGHSRAVVSALCEQGTPPAIVQTGNEITNGMIWPHPSERHRVGGRITGDDSRQWANFARILGAAVQGAQEAMQEAGSNTKLMLHFDNGGEPHAVAAWFSRLADHDVDYEIVGVSVHDHWSPGGKLAALARLDEVALLLPGKEIVVAETSHPYRAADRFDAKPGDTDPAHSREGQAQYLRSALEHLRTNPNGTGLFWWGSTFINDTFGHCPDFLQARALFTPDGSALPALAEFRL
jgi:arabinogalactan endo-1,4-beta-galactosidase